MTALYSLLAGVDATVEVPAVVGRDFVVDASSTTNVNNIQVSVQPCLNLINMPLYVFVC